jgi:hypothetical protein
MNRKVPISSGDVVISNKEVNSYDFVFLNLKTAKHFYISTFNYFMEKEYLEPILNNINSIRDIRVIFNAYNIETVNKIINNSVNSNPYVQLYYHPNNHSKIISNGQQMYIGSANYTGYSKENFEVGIQINDSLAISTIENEIFHKLFDYQPVISDPIQPIITLSTIIKQEYEKSMDWIKWFFNEAQNSSSVRENDIDDMDYNWINEFVEVFHKILDKVQLIVVNNPLKFNNDGIEIINFIDQIKNIIKSPDSLNLGLYSKQSFSAFFEDYTNCLNEYKDDFWIESILEMTGDCLSSEYKILHTIRTITDMLLYLKIKWIKGYNGKYNRKFIIYQKGCIKWLINPNIALQAVEDFLN